MSVNEIMTEIDGLPIDEQDSILRMLQASLTRRKVQKRRCEEMGRHYISVINSILDLDVLENNRAAMRVTGRRFVVWQLFQDGFTEYQIGDVVHRDHSTINHDKKWMEEMFRTRCFYPVELKMYDKFKAAL